jgi:hypothetical protein
MIIFLALLVTGAQILERRGETRQRLTNRTEATRLEITIEGKTASFHKETNHWSLDIYEGVAARDHRANDNLIEHLLDLVKTLKQSSPQPYDARDAATYGLDRPTLSIRAEWSKPTPGTETVAIGRLDLTGRAAFALFSEQKLFATVPSHTLELIKGKTLLDLRDRKVTRFETDDVEDIFVKGNCPNVAFSRDGDRWIDRKRSRKASTNIDRKLDELLGVQFAKIDEQQARPATLEQEQCVISIQGRRSQAETIHLYKNGRDSFLATNTALPASYFVSRDILKALSQLKND